MDQSARFWDKIAERYSKRPIADEAAYQKKLQVTREYFRPDMEVLEFGCGTGSTAITHAPYVKHIQAIDISSKMIEIAQGKADAKNVKNVTFEQSTIEEFSVSDQTLDAVLGLSILHLLDNKEEIIAKVHINAQTGRHFRHQHSVHWRYDDEVFEVYRADWKILRFDAAGYGLYHERIGRQFDRCRF